MTSKKERLDIFLFNAGYFDSREKAKASIMAGQVWVNGNKAEKPGAKVSCEDKIEVKGGLPYVSRGGLKLEKALKIFEIDLTGRIVLDVGASTGGFTDCALQNGAIKVYAVDVGYGQLAWKLRTDPRVVILERTNIRHLEAGALKITPDFITIDVSFISLEKIMPKLCELTQGKARGIALIKPQFEAGRENVGKKGVVKDPIVHKQVLERLCSFMASKNWGVLGLSFSPVKGPEGNIEYLMHFDFSQHKVLGQDIIDMVVENAHETLNGKCSDWNQ